MGSFLGARTAPPSPEEIRSAGLIAAVANVSIDVRASEIVVIMGLSGSGKSTLVRCLSRLVEPTAGEILFDGRDLLAMPAKELIELRRHRMGMVFQNFALMPHLSVLDNAVFPLAIQGVERVNREARARDDRACRSGGARVLPACRANSPAVNSSALGSPARSSSARSCGSSMNRCSRALKQRWAQCIKKVYKADPLLCTVWGGYADYRLH